MVDLAALSAPFPADRVSWRVGSTNKDKTKGMALAYIDARDVMDRLDEVCGPAGWQCSYPHANGKTVCSIAIKVGDEWIWKANGAGDTDIEAEKGALSDAFKRAAVCWGIGRYLYDLDSPWVAIEPMGRSYKIADGEKVRLARALGGKTPPTARPAPAAQPEPPTDSERLAAEALRTGIKQADGLAELKVWWADPKTQSLLKTLPAKLREAVEEDKEDRKAALTADLRMAG